MTTELTHKTLGKVKGIVGDDVVQYLGIPYATLSDRLAPPVILNRGNGDVLDATQIGPTAIQIPHSIDMEYGFIQHSLPHGEFPTSDTRCLNLNIAAPHKVDSTPSLPVLVFIHGGGFILGSNAWPQYDPTRLVSLSAKRKTPIVAVNINYRLGAFGFLTSRELREAGYLANNGLRDQQTALQWIKNHIGGFGGDPQNVTVMGVSAGAVSSMLHLLSMEPLFKRIVSVGGSSLLFQPLPESVGESTYSSVLKSLQLDSLSPQQRIKRLVKVPAMDLVSKVPPGAQLRPILDDDLVPCNVTFAQWADITHIPGRLWCESILLGDCQFDSHVLYYSLIGRKEGIAGKFTESLKQTLKNNPSAAEQLLRAYNIKDELSDDECLTNVLRFGNDVGFYAPAVTIAAAWDSNAYVYHFNEPNPWEGPWKGEATHVLDVAFLFQNYNDYLSEAQRKSAQTLGEDFIEFFYGRAPFPSWTREQGGAKVYGSPVQQAQFVSGTSAEAYGRRSNIFELVAAGADLDSLSAVWANFMSL